MSDQPQTRALTFGEERIARVPAHRPQEAEQASMLAVLARAAGDSSVDVEKFKALMEMQEKLENREARRAFNLAISEAKGKIGPVVKNKRVGFESKRTGDRTDYAYEDFAAVAKAVDPVLAEHGLSYRFRTNQDGATVSVTCILAHRDGYSEETTLVGAVDTSGQKNPIQGIGSAVTYLQRYTLKAALGLSAEVDTDGAATQEEQPRVSAEQVAELKALIKDVGADEAKLLAFLQVECLDVIYANKFEDVKAIINRKRAPKADPETKE